MNDDRAVPHPPYEEFRAALGDDHDASPSLDALHDELHSTAPDPQSVTAHASRLRGVSVLEARVANWWDDPNTQRWVKALTDAGV